MPRPPETACVVFCTLLQSIPPFAKVDAPFDTNMKPTRRFALAALVIFVVSHFLPAYNDGSGFACFTFCWKTLLGEDNNILTGGWFYYSAFAIANILFVALVTALFATKGGRKCRLVLSVLMFLQVLSWWILHLFQKPPQLADIKIGYYLWLIAYGLLAAAHLFKEPTKSAATQGEVATGDAERSTA
jgi:hypothetical protein